MDRPRVLLSNDDGISAPGLRALAAALRQADFCNFSVSGPSGERSAQSHCISIGKVLHAFEIAIEGAEEAWAVDGTPADSVMIAIYGPLLKNPKFDLVVSGINRGENCGLHVIYSGTVGAAREAACKDIPALALSLDNHSARSEEQYATAATYCVTLIKAVLGVLPGIVPRPLHAIAGYVINVNVPDPSNGTASNGSGSGSASGSGSELPGSDQPPSGSRSGLCGIRGFYLARQGVNCTFPKFVELEADPEALREEGHPPHLHMGAVTLRAFKNSAGWLRGDLSEGTDSWAVSQGWVAVTPVGLHSDIPRSEKAALLKASPALLEALASVLTVAAKEVGGLVGGIPDVPNDGY